MKETPTPEQLAKLPKWAQDYIKDMDRRAFVAERTLKEYRDDQTPSEFYVWDYESGAGEVKKFIQTHKMTVERNGVKLDILLRQDERGIDISWSDMGRIVREVALVPMGFNSIRIMSKADMR